MQLEQAVQSIKALQARRAAYQHALGVMYYDSVTVAPPGGVAARGAALEMLSEQDFKLLVNPDTERALNLLLENQDRLDAQTRQEALFLSREYEKISRIPVDEYAAFQGLINQAESVWRAAKARADYASFAPFLSRIVDTLRRFARYRNPDADPYGLLLDDYEQGLTRAGADDCFEKIRREIAPLIREVARAGRDPECGFLHRRYPIAAQRMLTDYLLGVMGAKCDRLCVGESEHPFTTNFGKTDVRITTHYYPDKLESSMYSVLHEGGHALYELNTADALNGSCLATGVSMGVHESQSRLFENAIGRSLPFIEYVFPELRRLFPDQLAGVSAQDFYRAVNRVTPSLIRIEADELTYSMHILVRYEMEKQLIDGELSVERAAERWRELYREYLGVDVPDDGRGILQDSHWSGGLIGYFPSYCIGSAYAAQMLAAMEKAMDLWTLVGRGDFAPITAYLTERVYRFGSGITPDGALKNFGLGAFNPDYYIRYLTEKYSALYGL